MNPGALREPITIVRPIRKENGFGEEAPVRNGFGEEAPAIRTEELLHTRAQIRHDRGFRTVENNEVVHAYDITFIVWLYVAKVIRETDEISWGGRRYRITSLQPVEESKILYIRAQTINE